MNVFVRLRRFAGEHLPAVTRAEHRAVRRDHAAALRQARANAAAYEKLLAAVEGREAQPGATHASSAAATRAAARIRTTQLRAAFLERLSEGASLEAAAASTVRELAEAGRLSVAASFADALAARPETASAGRLAVAVAAAHRKLPGLAWDEFRGVPAHEWRRYAVAEYLHAGFRQEPATALRAARDLVTDHPPGVGPADWYEVVRLAFVAGDLPLARQAYTLLTERVLDDPAAWPAVETEIAWLRPWMEGPPTIGTPGLPEGRVAFALMDYRQPSRRKTSQNIGDHVQTLASLGHLVRHENIRFHGEPDLADFITEMQQHVRPERRLDTPAGDVQIFTVDRDASNYEEFPERTWLLAFGWYMHPLFGLRHDFPMHPNLRPILVSFHCNKREMLTPESIDYLRRYGPVGCRDWTTVDLLLSLDVPAFFSGCLTTTVDTVFPDLAEAERPQGRATVYVDVRSGVPKGAPAVTQSYQEVKHRTFVANLREAVALLERYRRTYSSVVTSRLHCYLPVRSLGLEVDFRPKNRADVRFNGLIDIDDADFDAIRSRMLERLAPVIGAIVAGQAEGEVYQLWRDLCADDVAAARTRHVATGQDPALPFDVAVTCARIRAAAFTAGPAAGPGELVDVAVAVGPDDGARLPVVLDSMVAGCSRPVRVWLLTRGQGEDRRRQLTVAFPGLSVTWLACDGLAYGSADTNGAARRDLLLLPELLPDVHRVTVLPAVAVVLGDVAQLAGFDLAGNALAARSSVGTGATSGFGVFYRAARRLDPHADLAHDLYRRVHLRHVFDFDAFDTDVLVLDLHRMRGDGFGSQFLPYATHFGFTAREVLTVYAGPGRAVLPPAWGHVPTRERVEDPLLIHWAGDAPWKRMYVAGRPAWTRASERALSRGHGPAAVKS
jgi:hypothetical protein